MVGGATVCGYCKRVFQPGDFSPTAGLHAPPPEAEAPPPAKGKGPYLYISFGVLALAAGLFLRRDVPIVEPVGGDPGVPAAATPAPPPIPAPPPALPPAPELPSRPADGSAIPKGAKRVTVEGRIFDAASGKALPGVELVFKSGGGGERFFTLSDAKGGYRARLAWEASGYGVALRVQRSTVSFMEDSIPPVRSLDAEKRREAARDLEGRIAEPEEVFVEPGQRLKRDWVAVSPHK